MMSWTAVDHVHTCDVGRTTQYGFIEVLMGFGVDLSALLLFLLISNKNYAWNYCIWTGCLWANTKLYLVLCPPKNKIKWEHTSGISMMIDKCCRIVFNPGRHQPHSTLNAINWKVSSVDLDSSEI